MLLLPTVGTSCAADGHATIAAIVALNSKEARSLGMRGMRTEGLRGPKSSGCGWRWKGLQACCDTSMKKGGSVADSLLIFGPVGSAVGHQRFTTTKRYFIVAHKSMGGNPRQAAKAMCKSTGRALELNAEAVAPWPN